MKYQTTNLQPTKRYPTYQFHARTAQKKLPEEQVFCICVLETLHWLRSRLKKFSSLPEDICTPEPAQYEAFSMQQLHSFHSSVGAAVDVIWKTAGCGRFRSSSRTLVPIWVLHRNVLRSAAEFLKPRSLSCSARTMWKWVSAPFVLNRQTARLPVKCSVL